MYFYFYFSGASKTMFRLSEAIVTLGGSVMQLAICLCRMDGSKIGINQGRHRVFFPTHPNNSVKKLVVVEVETFLT